MNIKKLNEKLEKLLEYGEYPELNWADDFKEIGSRNDWSEDYLCKVGNKYCIATICYDESGDADTCDRSKLFKSKEECLDYYKAEYEDED